MDKNTFSKLYELIIGVTFDKIDSAAAAQGEPEAIIYYVLKDGSKDSTEYYNYNDNFYNAVRNGQGGLIVSRQYVERAANMAEELLK